MRRVQAGGTRRCGSHPPPMVKTAHSVGGACQQADTQLHVCDSRAASTGGRAHPGVARGARGLQDQPRVDRVRPQRAQRRDQPPAGLAARGDLAGAPPAGQVPASAGVPRLKREAAAGRALRRKSLWRRVHNEQSAIKHMRAAQRISRLRACRHSMHYHASFPHAMLGRAAAVHRTRAWPGCGACQAVFTLHHACSAVAMGCPACVRRRAASARGHAWLVTTTGMRNVSARRFSAAACAPAARSAPGVGLGYDARALAA